MEFQLGGTARISNPPTTIRETETPLPNGSAILWF